MTQLIDLGKLRFFFAGDWDASAQYEVNDVVKYGGNVYVYTFTLASKAHLPTDAAYWQLMVPGIRFTGTYNPATAYRVGDTVAYGATVYTNIADSRGSTPTDTDHWSTFITGVQFEGAYDGAVAYQAGDVATYGAGAYVATRDASGVKPSDTGYWRPLVSGIGARGVYNAATAYVAGDLAAYGGGIYRALGDTVGNNPSQVAYWAPFLDGIANRGAYDSATAYHLGDLVRYGGAVYRALGEAPAATPPTVVAAWSRYLDGIGIRGTWAGGVEYFPRDVVTRGGTTYIAQSFHASSVFSDDLAAGRWTRYNSGIRWRGTYAVGQDYLSDDLVTDGLSTYLATSDFTATGFANANANLIVLAKGADYLPAQAGNVGRVLASDGLNVTWRNVWRWRVATAPAVAINGDGFLLDSRAASFTITLPANPSTGETVRLVDFAQSLARNPVTLARNGSLIERVAEDFTIDTNTDFDLVFTTPAYGWKAI